MNCYLLVVLLAMIACYRVKNEDCRQHSDDCGSWWRKFETVAVFRLAEKQHFRHALQSTLRAVCSETSITVTTFAKGLVASPSCIFQS